MSDDKSIRSGGGSALAGSDHDEITGFLLRRPFLSEVDRAIAQASTQELGKLWLGVVSLPKLRHVNAALGFDAGDNLLREVAAIMQKELPEAFAMGRLEGGDLALASFGPVKRLSRRSAPEAEAKFLGNTVQTLGSHIFMSVRAGICQYRAPDDAAECLRKTQLALVRARDEAGGDLRYYTDDMGQLAETRARLVRELLPAIESDALTLQYQPQIDLKTGALVGVEALVRWPQPDGSFISPAEFIPIAERSELIVPLGDWVLRKACEQAAYWRGSGLPPFHVAVNVSPVQFYKTDLVTTVRSLLAETNLEPNWLELELTEGAVMGDGDESLLVLRQLRELGIELAIDDFGTGYSSLSYLKRFPVQRLKIDQSFVRNSHENADDRAITRTIIAIGKNLDMKVLAEGAETSDHIQFLASEGCDEAQGYYYARPLDAEVVADFVRSRPPAGASH